MEKDSNNAFYVFYAYLSQYFLSIVIWLYEHNK